MEDGYRLIDYGINLNDVIQLMIREAPIPSKNKCSEKKESETDQGKGDTEENSKKSDESLIDEVCEYYEVRHFTIHTIPLFCFIHHKLIPIYILTHRFKIW